MKALKQDKKPFIDVNNWFEPPQKKHFESKRLTTLLSPTIDFKAVCRYPKNNTKDDIVIFTDGGMKQQFEEQIDWEIKEIKKKREDGKIIKQKIIRQTVVENELRAAKGFGLLIQSGSKNIYGYGLVVNEGRHTESCEIKAMKEAIIILRGNFQDLDKHNIFLTTDSATALSIIQNHHRYQNGKMRYEERKEFEQKIKENPSLHEDAALIAEFVEKHGINLNWIRSHKGYLQNEQVDKLATLALSLGERTNINQTQNIKGMEATHLSVLIEKTKTKNNQIVDVKHRFAIDEDKIEISTKDKLLSSQFAIRTKSIAQASTGTHLIKSEVKFRLAQPLKYVDSFSIRDMQHYTKRQQQSLLARVNYFNVEQLFHLLDQSQAYAKQINYKIIPVDADAIYTDSKMLSAQFDTDYKNLFPYLNQIEQFNYAFGEQERAYIKNKEIYLLNQKGINQNAMRDIQYLDFNDLENDPLLKGDKKFQEITQKIAPHRAKRGL